MNWFNGRETMKDLTIQELRLRSRTRTKKNRDVSQVEQSIITIQQYFMTPGMHCIYVPNIQQGRSLLRICLDSLQIFADVALLTVATKKCPLQYRDLYEEMEQAKALTTHNGNLEEFILTSFYNDFLIIEYTPQLLEQSWFGVFEQLLNKYALNESIPVIMFMYDEYELRVN